jgi:hypothetical protein
MYERGRHAQHGKPYHVVKSKTNRKPARASPGELG